LQIGMENVPEFTNEMDPAHGRALLQTEKDALQVELSSRHAELSSCKQQCATYKDLNAKLKGKPSNQTCSCAAPYAGKAVRAARACYQLLSFVSLAADLAEKQKALVASEKATADEQVDGCQSPGHAPVLLEM
jgi:hypothetical protein